MNRHAILFAASLLLLAGCASQPLFTSDEVRNPCNIIDAQDINAATGCGLADLNGTERFHPDVYGGYSECEFSSGGERIVSVLYMPVVDSSTERLRDENGRLAHEVVGTPKMGDEAYLMDETDQGGGLVVHRELVVYVNRTGIEVERELSAKCVDDADMETIALLALSRFTSR